MPKIPETAQKSPQPNSEVRSELNPASEEEAKGTKWSSGRLPPGTLLANYGETLEHAVRKHRGDPTDFFSKWGEPTVLWADSDDVMALIPEAPAYEPVSDQTALSHIGESEGKPYFPEADEAPLGIDAIPIVHRVLAFAEDRTEVANADRLVELAGTELRYVIDWREWIVWDGQRWVRDPNGVVSREKAKAVSARLWGEVGQSVAPPVMMNQYIAFATATASSRGINSMLDLARGKLAVPAARLDASPMLLNLSNGTLDLRTGKLRPHDRHDYLTKLCPTRFDPSAGCPAWERFLGEVFEGNGEVIAYLQRFFGYGLTGDVSEQVLPIFWGGGSNGKSTLVNAVLAVVGEDHAGSPPQTLFKVSTHGDRHPTELMTLRGRRLMMAQETEAGCRLNEALIKHLTGGDRVTQGQRI